MKQLKQKRRITDFLFLGLGLNEDDFIRGYKSAVIRYRLNRQKKYRIFIIKFSDQFLHDYFSQTKLLVTMIYQQFKTSLNIKHT